MKFDANNPLRYKLEKIFWYSQIPAAVFLFIFFNAVWLKISVLYLVVLSIWAVGSTADGNEEAAKAREALDDNSTSTE